MKFVRCESRLWRLKNLSAILFSEGNNITANSCIKASARQAIPVTTITLLKEYLPGNLNSLMLDKNTESNQVKNQPCLCAFVCIFLTLRHKGTVISFWLAAYWPMLNPPPPPPTRLFSSSEPLLRWRAAFTPLLPKR